MTSKGKYHITPQAASPPVSSDDEMETSFSSFKTTTGKDLYNPLYVAGADSSANSSDTESPCSEDGLKSKGRRQRRRIPKIRVRGNVDDSDSTKLGVEKRSSIVHAQTAVPVSPTTIAEDATLKGTKESEN